MSDNKTLLVLGASSDIGIALIENTHKQYDIILAHYNSNDTKLRQLKDKIGDKMHLLQSDFSSEESVLGLIDQIKSEDLNPTHIVHLPAAKFQQIRFTKTQWEQYALSIDTGVKSIVLILKAFMPTMSKNKYGKVLFMLTSCVINMPPKYLSYYVTTKYALLGLMKSLSVEYANKGITVNGVSPEMIETKFLDNISEHIVQQNAANNPLGRNLNVDDVIPTMEFLLSDKADCITGQNIGITGGK